MPAKNANKEMTSYIIYILLFISVSIKSMEISKDPEEIEFDSFLNLFENCTVNLYNHKGLAIWISRTPVVMHTGTFDRIKHEFKNQAKIPDNCLTAIYILPTLGYNDTDDVEDFNDSDDFNDFYRLPKLNMENRYDILLTNDKKNPYNLWKTEYFVLLNMGRQSNGLIVQISKNSNPSSLYILSTIEIVNQFHVSFHGPLVTKSVDLQPIVSEMKRRYLDQAVANVNDILQNKDVKWSLQYSKVDFLSFPEDMSMDEILKQLEQQDRHRNHNGHWIQKIMQRGFMPSPSEGLGFLNRFGEGAEKYLIALTALGPDIEMEQLGGYTSEISFIKLCPTITFDVPHGPILAEKITRELGFVTCSKFGGPIYKSYTFLETVQNLLAVFENEVYYAGLLSYVLPALLLGVLYHCLLKKSIKKEYWITWHPFTWGLRALIWQAGNRRFNSLRFGWTAFMVTPWILVAVIISYVFRSHVLVTTLLTGPSGRLIYPRNPIKSMYDSGVTLFTDNYRLASSIPQLVKQRADWIFAEELKQNSSIAFIGWMEDIENIADGIGWGCRNSWGLPKVGLVNTWDFYFLSERYIYGLDTTLVKGWMISNWVDNRILGRLKALEGESGIVEKWREILKGLKGSGRWQGFSGVSFVNTISLRGTILYLFCCGGGGLAGALLVWIIEWVFYAVHTRPRRKWRREKELVRKKLLIEQMQVVSDSERGSVSSCEGKEDELPEQPVECKGEAETNLSLERNSFNEENNESNQGESRIETSSLNQECGSLDVNAILEQPELCPNILDSNAEPNVHDEKDKLQLEDK